MRAYARQRTQCADSDTRMLGHPNCTSSDAREHLERRQRLAITAVDRIPTRTDLW